MDEGENLIEKNKAVLEYLFLFLLFLVIFHFLYYDFFMYKDSSREFTAQIVVLLLNLFGVSSYVDGHTIMMSNFSIQVIYECVGIGSIIVYSSFVLAYPANLKKKLIGIAFGVPTLFTIAIVRISSLAIIGLSYPDMWEYFHVYFWQLSLIIFVILLLLLWVEKVVKAE